MVIPPDGPHAGLCSEWRLKKWLAEKQPTSAATAEFTPTTYKATFQPALFKSKEDMLAISTTKSAQIVDARGASRFYGREAEPRLAYVLVISPTP